MTIQDASNHLFTWFEEHDSFEVTRDLKKIIPIMDDEEATLTAFKISLEKLEGMELVASKDYADKKYYILEKHMDMFQQNVELGPWTAKFITKEINEFCEILDDNTDSCQTSNIQEKDVRNLVHVIQWYKARILEKEQIISGTASLAALAEDALSSIDDKEGGNGEHKNDSKKKKK
jgi:hypothetical protein